MRRTKRNINEKLIKSSHTNDIYMEYPTELILSLIDIQVSEQPSWDYFLTFDVSNQTTVVPIERSWRRRHETIVPLENRAENPWKKNSQSGDEFQGTLNKLTERTFDKLCITICDMKIPEDKVVVDYTMKLLTILFDKAVMEPIFVDIYIGLIIKINNIDDKSKLWSHVNVLKSFLSICKKEFDNRRQDQKLSSHKHKRRVLGNMNLIGTMFNKSLINFDVMKYCILSIIDKVSEEEDVEYLCRLISTSVEKIEKENSKCNRDVILKVYQRFDNIISLNNIASRVRYSIMDIIQSREVVKNELSKIFIFF